uniref:Uncharacterized protein n=1 Tax=Paramoeba aestuarina TaxID=180227 RepID=A0A7S4NW95_9EUKA|mmetsp:Transcript_30504/g.47407  ORF Transcript_30504/g.47407 Transcript_30504/m.47407 type:complete len:121 (+) Transcript_30504:33-395(+)
MMAFRGCLLLLLLLGLVVGLFAVPENERPGELSPTKEREEREKPGEKEVKEVSEEDRRKRQISPSPTPLLFPYGPQEFDIDDDDDLTTGEKALIGVWSVVGFLLVVLIIVAVVKLLGSSD